MSHLESKARQAAELLAEEHDVEEAKNLDPGLITLLQAILQALMKFLGDCAPNPSDAAEVVRRPGLGGRLRLRATVKAELAKKRGKKFARYDAEIGDAILTVGRSTTEADMKAIYKEVE